MILGILWNASFTLEAICSFSSFSFLQEWPWMILGILWNASFTLEAICSLFACFEIIYTLEFDTFEFCFLSLSTRKFQGSLCLHHDSLWWFDFVAFFHSSFLTTHHGPGTFLLNPSCLCFVVCLFWPFGVFGGEHNWISEFNSFV